VENLCESEKPKFAAFMLLRGGAKGSTVKIDEDGVK
jgi:hypothetical protein